jgi:alkyl hydroperoxide reductase subunit AhpC
MIGDTDFNVSKLYDMLPASSGIRPAHRRHNQTVRNAAVVGPDKKIKLVLVYPMTRPQLTRCCGSLTVSAHRCTRWRRR